MSKMPDPRPMSNLEEYYERYQKSKSKLSGVVGQQQERDDAVRELVNAIANPGPNPTVHFTTMARHRQEWPTLWEAIDKLVSVDIRRSGK